MRILSDMILDHFLVVKRECGDKGAKEGKKAEYRVDMGDECTR